MNKVLVVHPGASWSTHDVHVGVVEGLQHHGVFVAEWRLDGRLSMAHNWLHSLWRQKLKHRDGKEWTKPTQADVVHHATVGLVERAIELGISDVLIITAMFLPIERIKLMKQAGLRVWLMCTETPYHMEDETKLAAVCDGVFINDRSAVDAFRAVQPKTAYLKHAYRVGIHDVAANGPVTADVFFCGTLFPERIQWFNAIDWTGIDFHLYARTQDIPRRSRLRQFLKGGVTPNAQVVKLAQQSKISLNLFRAAPVPAESLNPRCYELTAAGACVVSNERAEWHETFGDAALTVSTPQQTGQLLRDLLAHDEYRLKIASAQRAAIAGQHWHQRAREVLDIIHSWHS